MTDYPIEPRNRVRRTPKRAHYDRDTVHAILDAARICHVGLVDGDGRPVVIPTIFGRRDDTLYLHGANASRLLVSLEDRIPTCITVTHVDGLVLARSAFHHALNYRSVVLFGEGQLVTDEDERNEAFRLISDQVLPGRWNEVRQPSPKELNATKVLRVEIDVASAKIRSGPPVDDEEDLALGVWAGCVPMATSFGEPQAEERVAKGTPPSPSVRALFESRR